MEGVPTRELGLFDSMCVIVGIVIRAGVYETAPTVASCMGSADRPTRESPAGHRIAETGLPDGTGRFSRFRYDRSPYRTFMGPFRSIIP